MQERPTEQTYASDLKEILNSIIQEYGLPFSKAMVEMIKEHKRADVLVYDNNNKCILIIEVKRPSESPFNESVVKQAYDYSKSYSERGLRYFATHNVNHLALWDATTGVRVDQFAITYVKELEEYLRRTEEIRNSMANFMRFYVQLLQGVPPKPIESGIIEVIQSMIHGIVAQSNLAPKLITLYETDNDFRKDFNAWLLDKGWESPRGSRQKLEEYCTILAKQFLYLFTNKVLFYNVLRGKYHSGMPQFLLPAGINASSFYDFANTFFTRAKDVSGDYETIFETNFIDSLPLTDDTAILLVRLLEYLNTLDYSTIKYDTIGKVFEQIIPQNERHVLGQYFTRSDIVDLILGFCVKYPKSLVFDPACGSGTFLVRAYYRIKYLEGKKRHRELLSQIWGDDIDKFPAHLSTINLAIRDLGVKENYPNIVYGDFFDIEGPRTAVHIGMNSTLTEYGFEEESAPKVSVKGLDKRSLVKQIPIMTAVVGNPPYTRQEELGDDVFGTEYKGKLTKRIKEDFGVEIPLRAGIYAYFFIHGAKFLDLNGRLGFVSLRQWLDTGYGQHLKKFLLDHFRIIAIIESSRGDDRWFPDAQMLPCIVILEQCSSQTDRKNNITKFVRINCKLAEIIPPIQDERSMTQEIYRWERVDEFVDLIENAGKKLSMHSIQYTKKTISLYEDAKYRIVGVKQGDLENDLKWGKYLSAPSIFFSILQKGKHLFCALDTQAEIIFGIKTGANELFCVPNKHFRIEETANKLKLQSRATSTTEYEVEKEFVKPVVVKIKKHRKIELNESDGYLLMVNEPKSKLRGKGVLKYINYGETKPITLTRGRDKGSQITGYHNISSVRGHRPYWYSLGHRSPPSLIFPSIFWGRFVVFYNKIKAYPTNAFFEIHPYRKENTKVLAALLNSTLTALIAEFSGRYIENRDKTISNQIMVYEVSELPIIDPDKISDSLRTKLEAALDKISKTEIGLRALFDPKDITDKEELDTIIFSDILGMSKKQISQVNPSFRFTTW